MQLRSGVYRPPSCEAHSPLSNCHCNTRKLRHSLSYYLHIHKPSRHSISSIFADDAMNIVFTAIDTYGDVLPFVAIGRRLARRGHDVFLYAPKPFRQSASRAGLDFDAMCTEAEYDEALSSPNLWHPQRGLAPLFKMMVSVAGRTMQWLEERSAEKACIVITSPVRSVHVLVRICTGCPS
ncbi:glycosyltransferase [Methylobacterium sp. R2-1]|uniref:glycosyltransferase n=1 Tax=Methylobacterium sp. R2-1 TaxID=2587064 RepID=UPI0028ADEE95|nr:glycosyltransferase [Methylobacterium sp. R2-1]